jgi:dTDP-4-dehydrorhamnose reductase
LNQPSIEVRPLEVWGGVECTVNRVGDQYHDQLDASGHAQRTDDLNRFAELGLRTLRYPLLWERTAPDGLDCADWQWADERLTRLHALGVNPIVGLVHHGSGPPNTNLLDESFVAGLCAYAGALVERYPWIEFFTPVNEPLTTARFSALYGHWYPHACSDEAFATALVHQCLATAESMRCIRRVNPTAQLMFTEDLAKTHSTPLLASQARFENARRWLSIDLLSGRVDSEHELWGYLARTSKIEWMLKRLIDEPMPPDLLGFNYYLTSERMLDERLERYPSWAHGGNGFLRYADIEAVRVRAEGIDGVKRLLGEAWERYRIPMVISEVHLCGAVLDQIQWVADTWRDALELRASGVDLRAITVWSLLGCFDWNSLCTRRNGHYEPGLFDVQSGEPIETELAHFVRQLARVGTSAIADDPQAGWWRTERRLIYPPVSTLDHSSQDERDIADCLNLEEVL